MTNPKNPFEDMTILQAGSAGALGDPESVRSELIEQVRNHQRETFTANQALLRKAAHDPAGFVSDLQKLVTPARSKT